MTDSAKKHEEFVQEIRNRRRLPDDWYYEGLKTIKERHVDGSETVVGIMILGGICPLKKRGATRSPNWRLCSARTSHFFTSEEFNNLNARIYNDEC